MNMQQRSELIKVPFVGKSMWPLLAGEEILYVDMPPDPIELTTKDIGALFIFKEGTEWICHRYLGTTNNKYLFKGDYSTGYEALECPHVLGRVQEIEDTHQNKKKITISYVDTIIVFMQRKFLFSKARHKKFFRYTALILSYFKKRFLK